VEHEHERTNDSIQAGYRIPHGCGRAAGRSVWFSGDVAKPGEGLGRTSESSTILVGACLPVARNPYDDQVRVDLRESLWSQTPFLQGSGTEILDKDIGFLDDFLDGFDTEFAAQVEFHGFLIPSDGAEKHRCSASGLAPIAQLISPIRTLNFDHFGTEVPKDSGGKRGGNEVPQFQDANSSQWQVVRPEIQVLCQWIYPFSCGVRTS